MAGELLNLYLGHAFSQDAKFTGSAPRQVDDATTAVRPPIINPDNDDFAIVRVCDFQ